MIKGITYKITSGHFNPHKYKVSIFYKIIQRLYNNFITVTRGRVHLQNICSIFERNIQTTVCNFNVKMDTVN